MQILWKFCLTKSKAFGLSIHVTWRELVVSVLEFASENQTGVGSIPGFDSMGLCYKTIYLCKVLSFLE